MTTWNETQVGLLTIKATARSNIGIPYDKYSDYHIVGA